MLSNHFGLFRSRVNDALNSGPASPHVCEGGFRRRTMNLLTLVSPMSMPSLRSSPWMRGAPQSGFSRLIFRISLRISFDTDGRPVWPLADFPGSEKSESFAVPSDDGGRFDDAQIRAPFGPGSTKPSPQAPVESIQLRLLHRALQYAELMAEADDLKLQCRPSSKNRQR